MWRIALCLSFVWAQLQDDFSDGDFTTNPTWSGTDANWSITPDQRLRSNGPAASATLYLSTPNTLINDVEWRFWVRVNFNPSASNFVRVYLVSNRANLTDNTLQGYFLRLGGVTGNLDRIELWRQNGTTLTKIADGAKEGRFGGTDNILRVRVRRTATGVWQVWTDTLGGCWELELTAADATFSTTTHFGVYFTHTSTNRDRLWFDDFYIGPYLLDNTPPQIANAEVLSPTLIRVSFSEGVDATAENPANYLLSDGSTTLSITQAVRLSCTTVELTLSQALTPSVIYTLSFSGISDRDGNSGSGSAQVVLPEQPRVGDLVFSEIMADINPAPPGLSPYEYVEIYNRSNKWIQLSGSKYCDAGNCVTLPARVLSPGSYLLLVPLAASAAYPTALALSSWPTLNDGGDSLTLLTPLEEVMEIVEYKTSWYRDPLKAQGGWSLEKMDLNDLCNADSNWIASTASAGGTPGAVNSVNGNWSDMTAPMIVSWELLSPNTIQLNFSEAIDENAMQSTTRYNLTGGLSVLSVSTQQSSVHLSLSASLSSGVTYTLSVQARDCRGNEALRSIRVGLVENGEAGDIVISEIMAKPTPVVGLPAYEYVEIHNRSPRWISLAGWQFCDASRCISLPTRIVEPGEYIILTSVGGASLLPNALGLSSFPTLNDSGDSLTLLNQAAVVVDWVKYSSLWYRDANKAGGGWSLEKIDLEDLCSADSNWIASTHPSGGTPGATNSVNGIWRDQTPPALISWQLTTPNLLLLRFSETLDESIMQQITQYQLSGGVSVTNAALSSNRREVLLTLSPPLSTSITYTLTVQGVDCRGNSALITELIGLPEPAARGDLIFSEIMAKPTPSVGLPPYEYVELYNRSGKWISLQGMEFCDETRCTSLPSRVIPPGSYIVLSSASGAAVLPNALALSSFPSLNDSGDSLSIILTGSGEVIEGIRYFSRWYRDPLKAQGGWSLERINLDDLC
ncbi:MAG: lamin tail domain-containing protein, partial [Bacteroidia bacterium]|nr:lamin tail domain-containing protein [Bacteroidia bacterium]